MADAFTVEAHDGAEGPESALWFAHEAGLDVFTSASIMQGQLAAELPDDVRRSSRVKRARSARLTSHAVRRA